MSQTSMSDVWSIPRTRSRRPNPRKAAKQIVRSRISASVKRARRHGEEGVVDGQMVEGEPLGVGHGGALLIRVHRRRLVIGHVSVEVLGHPLLLDRGGPEGKADGTVVQLGDAHPSCLSDPDREDALVVGGVDQPVDGVAHFGSQGPYLDGVAPFTRWDGDASHDTRVTVTEGPGGPTDDVSRSGWDTSR